MSVRDFWLDSIHIDGTYSAFLVGRPSLEAVFNQARKQADRVFGAGRATYIVEPERRQVPLKKGRPELGIYEMIPRWRHMAWINGPILNQESGFDGSLLILIWFADNPDLDWPTRLEGIVWEEHAKNWAF